jgi:hypothetical protein
VRRARLRAGAQDLLSLKQIAESSDPSSVDGIRPIRLPVLQLSTAAIGVAMTFALGVCGRPAGRGAAATVVRITERDFRISAPQEMSSGNIVFKVKIADRTRRATVARAEDGQLPPSRRLDRK